jgi:hypothetical protein
MFEPFYTSLSTKYIHMYFITKNESHSRTVKKGELTTSGTGERHRFFRELRLIVRRSSDQGNKRQESTASTGTVSMRQRNLIIYLSTLSPETSESELLLNRTSTIYVCTFYQLQQSCHLV